MALARVNLKSKANFFIVSPWTAKEWSEQIEMRLLGEVSSSFQLVDIDGEEYVVPVENIDFVKVVHDDGK